MRDDKGGRLFWFITQVYAAISATVVPIILDKRQILLQLLAFLIGLEGWRPLWLEVSPPWWQFLTVIIAICVA